jgi:regulatory protein
MTGCFPVASGFSRKSIRVDSDSDARRAHAASLRLLARRELSTVQVRQRLDRRGFAPSAIDQAIDRLRATGAIDDARTARAIARTQLVVRRRGPHRVRRELEAAGIEQDLIDATLRDELEQFDLQKLLEEAVTRSLKSDRREALDAATLRRLHARLVRQGFASSDIVRALRTRGQGVPDDRLPAERTARAE